uniref:Uncharacterized protein n=1 Tax=Rhipicephalus pulchellus TaxID=72859 RepID=L7LYB1_RHIPC
MYPAAVSTATAARSANPVQGSSGVSTDNGAELLRILKEVSRQLHRVSSRNSGFSPAASPSPAVWAVPVFRGFQDDVFLWVETINSLGALLAWPEYRKWIIAIDHLRDAAKAWHAYEGVRQRSWSEWCAKLTSLFRPLSSNCDYQAANSLSAADTSCATHSIDSGARTSTTLSPVEDTDCEGQRPNGTSAPCTNLPSPGHPVSEAHCLDGASVSCSSFTASIAERPAADIDTGCQVDFAVEHSSSLSRPTSRPSFVVNQAASKTQKSMTRAPSLSSPWHVEKRTSLFADTLPIHKLDEPMPAIHSIEYARENTNVLSHPPDPPRPSSAQSLDECADGHPARSESQAAGTRNLPVQPMCADSLFDGYPSAVLTYMTPLSTLPVYGRHAPKRACRGVPIPTDTVTTRKAGFVVQTPGSASGAPSRHSLPENKEGEVL